MEHEGITEIVDAQGWTEETLLSLVETFLHEKKLLDELEAFLQNKADEENEDQ